MTHNRILCAPLLASCLGILDAPVAAALSERAQRECSHLRQPSTGQPGKDVVWMPTTDALTTKMLELAKTTRDDRVFDLGAGDGRIPIAAAKDFGATAVGIEYFDFKDWREYPIVNRDFESTPTPP